MIRAANYGFAQHAFLQLAAHAFFFAQQALAQPVLQVFDPQHFLAQSLSLEEAQELRAKAETARTDIADIIDRLLITFFI